MTGVFDLFKIGIGPSSSHTIGPMLAAREMVAWAREDQSARFADRITCELLGSLSATGKGHGTNLALIVGLKGGLPETATAADFSTARAQGASFPIDLGGDTQVDFLPARDIVFSKARAHAYHPNAMIFRFLREGETLASRTCFSVGGGSIVTEDDVAADDASPSRVPFAYQSADELLALCTRETCSIADIVLANETAEAAVETVRLHLARVWDVMQDSIADGLANSDPLPGSMQVKRRAPQIAQRLSTLDANHSDESAWVSLWAIAVTETNAGFGRIVTAPTNGAAGIIPAVLSYYHRFVPGASSESRETFLLTAAAYGGLLKRNASISGADVGCQGEVGSAAAMAAAGLAACLGGTPGQIENAAEIALEHHLGMTCDPIGGLVQIPCIERNAIAANKAISAARLALLGDGTHYVSFDQVARTMLQTGRDMKRKYRETSKGGLAVNVPLC